MDKDIVLDALRLGNDRSIAVPFEEDGKRGMRQYIRKGDGVCDFCSARDELKRFPCRTFSVFIKLENGSEFENRFVGGWAACTICAPLVESQQKEALVQRAFATFHVRRPIPKEIRAALLQQVRQLHTECWKARL